MNVKYNDGLKEEWQLLNEGNIVHDLLDRVRTPL